MGRGANVDAACCEVGEAAYRDTILKDRSKAVTERPFFMVPDGDIFTDGSGYYGKWEGVAVAGTAVLQVADEGRITRALLFTLPTSFPQTVALAEQIAGGHGGDPQRGRHGYSH